MAHNTFRKFVSYLNNPDQDGGYYLPNIQRPFVWKVDQIERLFDSILREYPIGSLLIWKSENTIKTRKFIENYKDRIKLSDFTEDPTNKPKMLVLDGQQRLQSLFIGLKGKFLDKELCLDIISGVQVPPDDIKYKFKFLTSSEVKLPFVKFKDIVYANEPPNRIVKSIQDKFTNLSDDENQRINDNVNQIFRVFVDRENLIYQIVDSIDKPNLYSEEDVVEIFIRANSGGTKLDKSDLLFALLTASWQDADEKFEELLEKLNLSQFNFTRDFVLKTCLCLFDKGAAYNVDKFRNSDIKNEILTNWDNISASILAVKDFLVSNTFIQSDKTLPSYLVLIPAIYFKYKYPDKWNSIKDLNIYFIRSLISGAFSGNPDSLIDNIIKTINSSNEFNVTEVFGEIRNQNRSLEITNESLLKLGYGSSTLHLLFNLWYNFNYIPSFANNEPQIDHIFPQSLLKTVKDINPNTNKRSIQRYKNHGVNRIANCMLLTKEENGMSNKGDTPPDKWFSEQLMKYPNYLDLHLIPTDPELWKLENYDKFIEEREKLILNKFNFLLIK